MSSDLEKAKEGLKQIKKEQAAIRKSRVKGFNSNKVSGMFGNIRRSEEIRFHSELKIAKQTVEQEKAKEIKVPYSAQELIWLGYKNKKDYIERHTKK